MKVLMTVPIELAANLQSCELKSPKFLMLKNGLIERERGGEKVLKLLCEREDAQALLDWATRVGSLAAGKIRIDEPPFH